MQAGPFDLPGVAASYEDWYASPWGQLADRLETELIVELLGDLAPGARVLDAGCGTGHFARALAGRGLCVTGADASARMLAGAAERTPGERLSLLAADATRLPFAERSFDAVLCAAVLEFCARPAELLGELSRVTTGPIALLTLNARSYLGLRRRAAGWKGHPVFARVRPLTRAGVRAAARTAGLRVERERGVLYLPPVLGGRLHGLEQRLARGRLGAGVSGFRLARA